MGLFPLVFASTGCWIVESLRGRVSVLSLSSGKDAGCWSKLLGLLDSHMHIAQAPQLHSLNLGVFVCSAGPTFTRGRPDWHTLFSRAAHRTRTLSEPRIPACLLCFMPAPQPGHPECIPPFPDSPPLNPTASALGPVIDSTCDCVRRTPLARAASLPSISSHPSIVTLSVG